MNIIFMYQLQSLYHRLLCHSLVLSGKPSTVDSRLSTEESTAQECDATSDAMCTEACDKTKNHR